MNPAAAAGTAFLIILPSELPDKTWLARGAALIMVVLAGASIMTALSSWPGVIACRYRARVMKQS